jgi:hypothetical protein
MMSENKELTYVENEHGWTSAGLQSSVVSPNNAKKLSDHVQT